jgi:hypothetical protein
MFLNIITPCTRPHNLYAIAKSINIPKLSYRWIVVCDSYKLPDSSLIPDNAECYLYKNNSSVFGNAQRNYALSMVKHGHVYFNDDDTTIHPLLWKSVNNLSYFDFISFKQLNKDGTHRLNADKIVLNNIDSHNIIISNSICKNKKFILDKYDADGVFAEQCFSDAKNAIFLNEYLSVYNSLS